MTAADRDSAVRMLREIAARLAEAPAKAEASARQYADRSKEPDRSYPYEVGALQALVRNEVGAIEVVINHFLTPASKSAKRGKR